MIRVFIETEAQRENRISDLLVECEELIEKIIKGARPGALNAAVSSHHIAGLAVDLKVQNLFSMPI